MKYHTGPRFGLSEEEQSLIYWTCVNFDELDPETRHKVIDAVQAVGGIDATAVFEAVTTREPIPRIAIRTIGTSRPIDASHLAKRTHAVYLILSETLPALQKVATGDPPTL